MNRIKVAAATITLLLIMPLVVFTQTKPATEGPQKVAQPQKEVPLKITDEAGRSVKLETLTPENRARVERVRKAAESLRNELGTSETQRFWVTIHCQRYPKQLVCTIMMGFD